jgi:hypothetical protein
MAPKIATKTLRIPHTNHRVTPDLQPSALNHTLKKPKLDDSPVMTTTTMKTKTKRMVFEGAKTRANPIWCYSFCSSSQECKCYSLWLLRSIDDLVLLTKKTLVYSTEMKHLQRINLSPREPSVASS